MKMASDPGIIHVYNNIGELTYDDLLGSNPRVYDKVSFNTEKANLRTARIIHQATLHWDVQIKDFDELY